MYQHSEVPLKGSAIAALGVTFGGLVLFLGQSSTPQPFVGTKPTPTLPTSPFQPFQTSTNSSW